MGYLSNADLWYELFRNGTRSGPEWFCKVTKSKARFNKAMAKLHDYSLVEALPGHYSVHAYVHDWVSSYLNGEFQMELFCLAIECVTQNIKQESEPEFWLVNSRLTHHALTIPGIHYSLSLCQS
ncbi:hypothetical protein GJ744_003098 [Endocarpon pusillum]|uniref:Uncharacterized protein n=1 Tax=Endocarpon pusillum TaxID=364733 RepID=A0A8H7AVG1_9EURO|nr:hypothetical protein GJ744_003098 [Endocarpon pusillum]